MPATRRKTAATTTNVDERNREERASLLASDRSGKTSSADSPIEETIRSHPRSVKDICYLRNSDAALPPSPASIAVRFMAVEQSMMDAPRPIAAIGVVRIVDIPPYMCRIMAAGVVIGVIVVDRGWT
jgi:hypothetical protein